MRHRRHLTLLCPGVDEDPLSGLERECNQIIHVRAWPGRPATWADPEDPAGWEAWGCRHVEEPAPRVAGWIEDRLAELARQQEDDALAALEARADAEREARWLAGVRP